MESGGPWTARSRRRAKAGPAPASRTGSHHATILGSCNSLGVTKHEVHSKRSRPSFERRTIVLKGRARQGKRVGRTGCRIPSGPRGRGLRTPAGSRSAALPCTVDVVQPELARPEKRSPGGTVSWPWVPACGSLEPCRRGGENAQRTGKNGGKMGEIWSKRWARYGLKGVKESGSPEGSSPSRRGSRRRPWRG